MVRYACTRQVEVLIVPNSVVLYPSSCALIFYASPRAGRLRWSTACCKNTSNNVRADILDHAGPADNGELEDITFPKIVLGDRSP